MSQTIKRREVIKNLALGTGVLGLGGIMSSFSSLEKPQKSSPKGMDGRINHSVCRWCFPNIPLEKFAVECAKLGIKGIDLLKPEEWDAVEKHGLVCSMATDDFANIQEGFNDPANHSGLQEKYKELIDKASEHDIKNVICFSGNRRGLSDIQGIENCAKGLIPLLDYAAERNVNLVMELLNSKVDHKDYQCDHTEWGVALAEKMGRDNFKLLYDIYHMQIMEGDVISTIRKYNKYINHYHTAGVPGRNEINESQELFYPAIIKAIADTGFDGFVAQEFIPTYEDKLSALEEAIRICDV